MTCAFVGDMTLEIKENRGIITIIRRSDRYGHTKRSREQL
jgi:hypothetical protein